MRFLAHDFNDMERLIHERSHLFIPPGITEVTKPLDWVVIVVEELMDLLKGFPEKVERLDFNEFGGLGFGHADSLIFDLDNVVFIRELGLGYPIFFIGIGVAWAGAPESDFLVLYCVYIAEDD